METQSHISFNHHPWNIFIGPIIQCRQLGKACLPVFNNLLTLFYVLFHFSNHDFIFLLCFYSLHVFPLLPFPPILSSITPSHQSKLGDPGAFQTLRDFLSWPHHTSLSTNALRRKLYSFLGPLVLAVAKSCLILRVYLSCHFCFYTTLSCSFLKLA